MARAYGKVFLVIHILVAGKKARLMDMVFISGKMETNTRANGKIV
jgi:hypothetical protein